MDQETKDKIINLKNLDTKEQKEITDKLLDELIKATEALQAQVPQAIEITNGLNTVKDYIELDVAPEVPILLMFEVYQTYKKIQELCPKLSYCTARAAILVNYLDYKLSKTRSTK